jgi:hypothetical protein
MNRYSKEDIRELFSFTNRMARLVGRMFVLLSVTSGLVVGEDLSLQALVSPSTVILKEGHPVTFAIHGFIEFKTLWEAFPYIESQTRRWESDSRFGETARQRLERELLRRAVESRVVSMIDERPLEILVTHTAGEVKDALQQGKRASPARLWRSVSTGAGEMEAFIELLEFFSVDRWTCTFELVSDRRRD